MAHRTWCLHIGALLSIILISAVCYLPATYNSFISDDFGLFTVIEVARTTPSWFFESTTEFFRLMSYVYFALCYWAFGLNAEPYYWAGIALHAAVSVCLYWYVFESAKSLLGAWAAGLFFSAYERHQEAIMWISAANETILALNCLIFLLLWRRAAESNRASYVVLAHVVFAAALFSKEAAVVLVPLAAIQLLMRGDTLRTVLRRCSVLIIMLGMFAALWTVVAHRNFFLTHRYYAFSWQFVPVYARSLVRIAMQFVPLIGAWAVVARRQPKPEVSPLGPSFQPPAVLFGSLLLLGIVPYSFLTYLNHIPSRNTYLASIGLAGLFGLYFASLYMRLRTGRTRVLCLVCLSALVTANAAYLWLKKEPQYQQRAAPTRQLIATLNAQRSPGLPVRVCGFPLDPWVFTEAVTRFTSFTKEQVVLDQTCEGVESTSLRWDEMTSTYVIQP